MNGCVRLVAFLLLAIGFTPLAATSAETRDAGSFFALNTGELKTELADARAAGLKGLMLFFEQEGCPGCRHMKQNVLNRREVQDYYGKNFVSLAIDIYGSVPLRDFAGREDARAAQGW